MMASLSTIIKNILLAPIRVYRNAISPYLPRSCRYHPSCSSYAMEAIQHHGPAKGVILSILRISRCHPFSAHCYHDPVPSAFTWGDLLRYKRRNTQKE